MLPIKTVILSDAESQEVEQAIRHYSSKRHTALDFHSSSSYIPDGKYFLGTENDQNIEITRIRTSFEQILPKIIVRFSKKDAFGYYQMRLSFLASMLVTLLILATITSIASSISSGEYSGFPLIIFGLFLFISLMYIEIRLTGRKISNAIKNYPKSK